MPAFAGMTKNGARRNVSRGDAMTIEAVDYTTKIPNNVNLAEDRQVLRALESWHPGYIDWWKDMGPEGFQQALVYLRTAVSVDPKGWPSSITSRCPTTAGAFCWRRRRKAVLFRSAATAASRSGRTYRANTAPCCGASSSFRAT